MDRFVMTPIPEEDVVVLDVPEGKMILDYEVKENGEGLMYFYIHKDDGDDVLAMKMSVQSPKKARVLSAAFKSMAEDLEDGEECYVEGCECDPDIEFFFDEDEDDFDEDNFDEDDLDDEYDCDECEHREECEKGNDVNKVAEDLVDLIQRLFPGIRGGDKK